MAQFTAEVFQNEFLPDGGTDVHAVVALTCTDAGAAGQAGSAEAAEVIIIDTSGSMYGEKIIAARTAAASALDQILDGTWFAVVAGTERANPVFPDTKSEHVMVQMDEETRTAAKRALGRLEAGGGTAMGSWLLRAKRLFDSMPRVTQRHAILLTDGCNQSEKPKELAASVRTAQDTFQCDCRGVGADWDVSELRGIATAMLGTVDLIPGAESMPQVFAELMQQAMGRGVADAQLRVWAPQGAQVLFVRQVSPQVEDLTGRRTDVNPLTAGYPTGAWGDETREYHVAVRLPAKPIGSEQLAARVQLVVHDEIVAGGLVRALWSADDALTTRISPEVAHYTGQTELAEAIQGGLAARAAGDEDTARVKLGRAVQLAEETGDEEATSRLKKVVDIEDAATGKVRLRQSVDRLDEMALDTNSTRTAPVRSSTTTPVRRGENR